MLRELLTANHEELVRRCRAKVTDRAATFATDHASDSVVPILVGQLVRAIRTADVETSREAANLPDARSMAATHGSELLRNGYTIDQVVHDYGDLFQAVTELALETNAAITVAELHTFNRCIDAATADAVTEFGRERDVAISDTFARSMHERIGSLAHELRNVLNSAMLSYETLESGPTPPNGIAGKLLGTSLKRMRDLITRSLDEVRATTGFQVRREPVSIRDLLTELHVSADMEARSRRVTLTIAPITDPLEVQADRLLIACALSNVVQNALKFTRPEGRVALTARAVEGRVLVDVEDECGGIRVDDTEELFKPFEQRNGDRTGLGLGLSISRRGVEANGGEVRIRNLPGKGCVFTIELPTCAPRARLA